MEWETGMYSSACMWLYSVAMFKKQVCTNPSKTVVPGQQCVYSLGTGRNISTQVLSRTSVPETVLWQKFVYKWVGWFLSFVI